MKADTCATCHKLVADHGAAMVCPPGQAVDSIGQTIDFDAYLRNSLRSMTDIATRDEMAKLRQRIANYESELTKCWEDSTKRLAEAEAEAREYRRQLDVLLDAVNKLDKHTKKVLRAHECRVDEEPTKERKL